MNKLWQMSNVYFTMSANTLLYYMKNFSLTSFLVPTKRSTIDRMKWLYGTLGLLVNIIKRIIGISVNVIIFMMLPFYFKSYYHELTSFQIAVVIVIVAQLANMIRGCKVVLPGKQDSVFLNSFQMDPSHFYKFKLALELIGAICSVPVYMYYLHDIFNVSVCIGSYLLLTCIVSYAYILYFNTHHKAPNLMLRMLGFLLFTVLCYVLLPFITYNKVIVTCSVIILVTLGIYSFYRLLTYPHYLRLARVMVNTHVHRLTVMINADASDNVNTEGLSKYTAEKNKAFLQRNANLEGISYFNKAFFERNNDNINRMYIDVIMNIMIYCIVFLIIIKLNHIVIDEANVIKYSPIIVSLLVDIGFAGRFNNLSFFHADVFLMENHIYNSNEMIYQSFKERYVYVVKKDMLILLMVLAVLIGMSFILDVRVPLLLFVELCVCCVMVLLFAETYRFAEYYLYQPYQKDGNTTKPLHHVFSALEGIFTIVFLFVRGNIAVLTVPLVVVTFILICIIFYLIKKNSVKTFTL